MPHALLHESVEIRATEQTVEIYHKGKRVAGHRRSVAKGRHTTLPEHMPAAHRKHAEWSPSRLVNWGASIGPHTKDLVERILAAQA